ncbi:LPS-assembly protein LptD [Endozoicomonas sp. SM1973]|uniref:LPS-assembly protein LptD n=1 Tax=Spartinivicinus marinus TaxID=2994442 RepID=A0A853ICS0_9GAMM|nr:LPS-assembly protein LptD [Spartinivicinus marinus]MCX4028026.1 LPS-assembly protein LptD [Spartinivicinus marinus]NYZ68348.1 LPS-assembly protein LptD [Spartinivicinus marinus]
MAVKKLQFTNNIHWLLTTGLLAGSTSLTLYAAPQGEQNSEWHCLPGANGQGWNCNVQSKPPGTVKRAPRPPEKAGAADTSATTIASQEEPVNASPVHEGEAFGPLALPQLDWVSLDQLTEEQRQQVAPQCSGAYIEPFRLGMDYQGNPADAPIYAEAQDSEYDQDGTAKFTGKVLIRQGYRQLQSDNATLHQNTDTAEFEGNVILREPNLLLVGQQAAVNLQSGRMDIKNARYLFHKNHSRGEATTITRREDELVVLESANYTTCPPDSNAWTLTGKDITLNKFTGFGSAKHATIRVAGIPVFYTPYIYFPIDDRRQSGFLAPTIGTSGDNGFDLTTPYYFNLAPNYDATLYPRYMAERGFLLEGEFRYLTPNSSGEVGGAYLGSDDLKDGNRQAGEDRWYANWIHDQRLTDRWKFNIDYTKASDKDYFRDFGTSLEVSSQDNLNQAFKTVYNGGDNKHSWTFTTAVQKYQNMSNTSDDSYEKVPQFEFKGNLLADNGLEFDYLTDVTYFTRDKDWKYQGQVANRSPEDIENDVTRSIYGEGTNEFTNAKGSRFYAETGVKYKFEWPYAFVTPGLKFKHVQYRLTNLDREDFVPNGPRNQFNLKYDTSPSTTTPVFTLDSGLLFDRKVLFGESQFTQTLEPRALYVYSPEKGDQEQNPVFDTSSNSFSYAQLWRDNRFSGYDRLGDANQIALGVTSRFIEDNGFERFRVGTGQIFYFKDREVLLDPNHFDTTNNPSNDVNIDESTRRYLDDQRASTSPLASELVWNITSALSFKQDWIYNTNEGRNEEFASSLRYHPDYNRLLNFSYRFRDQVDRTRKDENGNAIPGQFADGDIEQADLSFIWPVASNWSALGRWNYDVTNSRRLEAMFGAEYDSCCYKIRFIGRQWIDGDDDIDNAETDNGVFVQFVMKGLGNLFGSKVEGFLEGIDGYREREERNKL